jgi:superfamily II DNA or RNA helicase
MELRPYQKEAVQAVFNEWEQGRGKTLLILVTGGGKTICFADIANTYVQKGKRVLILAHRDELLQQAADKLKKSTGLIAEYEKAQLSAVDSDARVIVGSVQTLASDKRLNAYPVNAFDLIIIDEAHHCLSPSYQKVLGYFNSARILGVTATPDRADKKSLLSYFESVAYDYPMIRAVKEGYLSPIKALMIPLNIDISSVKISCGDYVPSELGHAVEPYLEQIAEEMTKYCMNRKTVVFLPLVAISQQFCELLKTKGFKAVEVNGQSEDRKQILEDFERGKYNVITNACLLTEGWDCPSVDCIVNLRPTKSRALYCLDENTEILTNHGWVKDAKIGDMVAAYDKNTGEIVYTPVIEKVRRPLEKDEYFCSIKSPTLDIRVTNKHRMLYDNKNRLGWKFTTAEQLASLKSGAYIPVSGNIKTKGIPLTDDEIKFLTWFMTDGTLNKANGVIEISQGEHQPWLEDIASCISACNMKYGRRSSWRETSFNQTSKNVIFYISYGQPRGTDKDKRGWAYLEKYVDKDIPDSFFEMNDHQFDIMLKIAHLADGAKNIYSVVEGNSYHISKGNKRFIERLQVLAITHEYKANIAVSYQNKSPLYTLHVKKKTYAVCGSTHDNRPTWIKEPHTQENCWCVQNVYGTLITRRNGKVSIVGNCQIVGRGTRLSPETGKKELLLLDFLWMTQKLSLCRPSCIVAKDEAHAKKIDEMVENAALLDDESVDILDAEEQAEKDIIQERKEALAKELQAQRRKKAKLVDPLQFVFSINENLDDYEPEAKWEFEKPSPKQLALLEKFNINPDDIDTRGKATRLIDVLMRRANEGLSTAKQIRLLERYGFNEVGTWTKQEAGDMITRISENRWMVPFEIVPSQYYPDRQR